MDSAPDDSETSSVPYIAPIAASLGHLIAPLPISDDVRAMIESMPDVVAAHEAIAAAPAFRELAAAVQSAAERRVATSPVPCGSCGTVLAVLVRAERRLYRRAGPDSLGAPFSLDPAASVELRCRPCGKSFDTSGRAVWRNLGNDRPLLA